ncbi:MAG: hypothetical protein OEW48_12525 [Phycisphaerae bacterium]|nr:hypothetical protein [Phycisphaerae bacterium]
MAKIIWGHSTPVRRRNKGVIFLLFAAALIVGALGPKRALACDVTDVDLWIGDTSSLAQEGNPFDVFKCPDCYFGWYVEWDADPGYGDFNGEIWLAGVLISTFFADSSKEWKGGGTHSVPGYMSPGPKTVQAWMRRAGGEWCPSNTRTLVVTEIEDVTAGAKHATETLYRAQDYLDEPSERQTLTQGVTAVLSEVITPDCFYWVPDCDEYLPTICPDDGCGATFSAKDHDLYSIGAGCGNSSKTMSIALEGINIYTYISSEDEMTETYNIFLNENFDQKRESTTLPGHKQCYYVDNSDDSLTSPNYDNMSEIGWINIYAAIYGDTDATVKFNASGIKLYDSSQEHNKLEFNTEYNIVDIGGSIYVEGISTGTTTLSATIETQDGYTTTDQLKIKVIPLDLVAVDPAPSSDQHEICHKEKLLIRVNNNDSDNDGTVDLLDFELVGGDPDLAHIILEKPLGAEASDISGSITVIFPANLNAFCYPEKTGGIEAPDSYSFSDLPFDIYLEGKSASSDILKTSVAAEIYFDSGVKGHDEIRYTVIKVDIESPKGSLDAVKNPEASWLSSSSRFDFQGVISMAPRYRPYVLGINGDIKPTPSLSYLWTLDAAAGTLTDDTTATPDHTAPATEGQGMLTLKAMIDTMDTGLKDERKVKIYKDHLERDKTNFETGGSCDVGWKVTTFNVDPQPTMIKWNCHGSTNHACDGSGNGSSSGLSSEITSWDKDTFDVLPINWSNVQAVLDRGDVVAYYAGSSLQHSATCISSTTTWGANNEPVTGTETWKWYLATPQDWWNNAGINNPPLPDCTKIIVYNKP